MEYEGLPQICFGCGQYGHRVEACQKSNVSETVVTPEGPPRSEMPSTGKTMEEGYYDPWMLPNRGRQKYQDHNVRGNKNTSSGAMRGITTQKDNHQLHGRNAESFIFTAKQTQAQLEESMKQPSNGGRLRFAVLENLDEEQDSREEIEILKEKLQQLQ